MVCNSFGPTQGFYGASYGFYAISYRLIWVLYGFYGLSHGLYGHVSYVSVCVCLMLYMLLTMVFTSISHGPPQKL